MSAASIIGVIAGLLKIVQFGIDNFGGQEENGSKIRIAVGLDTDGGLNNAGGNLPDVRLFNEAGDFIEMVADPGDIEDGGTGDYTVEHESTQQATYALFSANDDAICVAFASITWASGDKYAWIGDWGEQCGGSWYFSNYYIQGTNHKPNCLWIDADGDQPQTGFQVHWPEFVDSEGDQVPSDPDKAKEKVDYLCSAGPPFSMYTEEDPSSINYWIPNSSTGAETALSYGRPKSPASAKFRNGKGKSGGRRPKVMDHLVVDDSEDHTASRLCGSESSRGPDYVSLKEGMFCSMDDKTLHPICKEGEKKAEGETCFDVQGRRLLTGGVAARGAREYPGVVDWTAAGRK